MLKPIKADCGDLPANYIPYQNRWKTWVWRAPDTPEDLNWPGIKAPKWATKVVHNGEKWCWSS